MLGIYTCITCRVAFHDGDSQRHHYKSDWHRYNLKRKVAELPPVFAEEFVNRVHAQRNDEQKATEDKSKYCDACHKNFNNEKSFDNHLNSKKHKENEAYKFEKEVDSKVNHQDQVEEKVEEDTDSDREEVDSDEWEEDNPAESNYCLFCKHKSRSLVRNLRHMSLKHSFFIPDAEFCTNATSLIRYLGEKVFKGFMCLWCNDSGRGFHSAEAAQGHMRDKGHCKMLHEGEVLLEYADFYDYSSSYPNGTEGPVDLDEEINLQVIDGTDYQLVLPSGAVIGHRSLSRYYKQRLNPTSAIVAVPKTKNGRTIDRMLAQYKAIGWTETKREQVVKKARDLKYMHRIQSKWETKLSVRTNQFQPHFRQQVNF